MRRFFAAAVAGALGGCAQAPSSPTIAIEARYPYATCVGDCIEFGVTLDASGAGEVRFHQRGDEWQASPFRVEPQQVEAFRKRLSALRPASGDVRAEKCRYDSKDAAPNTVPFAIEWRGDGGTSRLEACAEEKTWLAIREALRGLRLSIVQRRVVSAEEAADPDFL